MRFLPTVILLGVLLISSRVAADMPWVKVSGTSEGFVLEPSGQPFIPWGFNYDHDRDGALLEDYWNQRWAEVEEDFAEMKELGANVVRVHLQFGRFMDTADRANPQALEQLGRLLELADAQGLYLDLTGLGCYHKQDVPPWYDELSEQQRWDAQAAFWSAVAERCKNSPAVFCYDLMNEPVVPGGKGKQNDWLGPAFAGKHFVQFITLETQGRPRDEIARAWIAQLVAAIREHDTRHLITVGLVPWSLDRPGLSSGFIPEKVTADLDFIAMHLYPESGKLDEALETLAGFSVGKPLVIEEMFPLKCSASELGEFIERSKQQATGWIGFYWGQTPAELEQGSTIGEALTLGWLKLFQEKAPTANR